MLALGTFQGLKDLFAGAAISVFASVLGVLLLIGFLALAAFIAVLTVLIRNRGLDDSSPEVADKRAKRIDRILGRAAPQTARGKYFDGLRAPLDGFRFMNTFPWHQCWRYAIAPAICSVLISALVIAGVVAAIAGFAAPVHDWFEPGILSRLFEFVTFAFLIVLTAGIGFGVWLFLQNVVCGSFLSKLASKVEQLLGTDAAELQEQSFAADVTGAVRDTMTLMTVEGGLLAVNLVPGIGSVVALAGGGYFGARFVGVEFQSYPLSARGMSRADRKQFTKQHRWHVLGLGTASLGLALIPGVGAMLLATSAVGGVLQYHRLK